MINDENKPRRSCEIEIIRTSGPTHELRNHETEEILDVLAKCSEEQRSKIGDIVDQ